MGISQSIIRTSQDGFRDFIPSQLFVDEFETEHKALYAAGYAFYSLNFVSKLEKKMGFSIERGDKKYVSKCLVNNNKDIVDNEVVYTMHDFLGQKVVVALSLYWDTMDYPVSYDEEDEDFEEEIPLDRVQARINLYCLNETKEIDRFFKKFISKDKKPLIKEKVLNIICSSADGLYLKSFRPNKFDLNIEDNYNENFIPISDEIVTRLQKKSDNGIILLHSEPGCGKTSYLRYLTNVLTKKRLIYLPPDMAHRLAEPDFMSFLMNYPESVLIIEDAENCLQKRDAGGNQAVSNLLNSSDGLLGDALKLQIICTFNCPVTSIDPALMRPGRLIAEYKFEKLDYNKTLALVTKLHGEDVKPTASSMTLAEIYNMQKKRMASTNQNQSIGFNKK